MTEENKPVEAASETSAEMLDKARELVSDARESVGDVASKVSEQAKAAAAKVKESLDEATAKATETAKATAEKATETAKDFSERASAEMKETVAKVQETVSEALSDAQEAIAKTPLGDLIESQKRALIEAGKAIEALIPTAAREHGEKAVREMVEGYKSLFNMTVEQVSQTIEKATGIKLGGKDETKSE